MVRPSGTEPKLKCYCEVVAAVTDGDAGGLAVVRAAARERLSAVTADVRAVVAID